jgi:hypothetical protein
MRLRKALHNIFSLSTSASRENIEYRRTGSVQEREVGRDPVIQEELVNRIPVSSATNDEDKLALRKQQQCLVFYNHSIKCTAVGNECPKLGTYCEQQKKLSKHLAQCDDVNCSFPHCHFSRQVFHHYLSCKDKKGCQLCRTAQKQMLLLDNQIL